MIPGKDSTQRFSDRVENYLKYRPGYPAAILDLLQNNCGLTPDSIVADIGSGTGLLSQLFLQNGNCVIGVEPNREMRQASRPLLHSFPNFSAVAATAEESTLVESSIDFIVAGQAFHWFDPARARQEFVRILKPEGWTLLVWNDRRTQAYPFLEAYELLLVQYGTHYTQVQRHGRNIEEKEIADFFAGKFRQATFPNRQTFDWQGLKGRMLSSSYTPPPEHPAYAPMLEELRSLFRQHNRNGLVNFEYDTQAYYGQL